MATPTALPTSFAPADVLTAANMNLLRGAFRVLQVVSTTKTDTFTTSSTTFTDITGMTVSITPSSSTSKILVVSTLNGCHSPNNNDSFVRLLRGSTAISIGDTAGSRTPATFQMQAGQTNWTITGSVIFLDSPATTSATTYKLDCRVTSNSMYINRSESDADVAGRVRTASTITVMEISA